MRGVVNGKYLKVRPLNLSQLFQNKTILNQLNLTELKKIKPEMSKKKKLH